MFPAFPNRVFVPDLGCDCLRVFALDDGRLQALEPVTLAPGSGPRHVVAHPSLKILYVMSELDNTVTVVHYTTTAAPKILQTLSTLPPDFKGVSYGAAIRISPTGSHVYAANRVHDSITVLAVGPDGLLTFVACESVGGHCPRDFNLVEGFLIAACQVHCSQRASGTLVSCVGACVRVWVGEGMGPCMPSVPKRLPPFSVPVSGMCD
jgi:6-phosphogluconolactonase